MTQKSFQPGCYLNPKEKRVVRVSSPYWIPPQPEWVLLTDQVNATIKSLREIAAQRKLVPSPGEITWGQLPDLG
ncbi:MAG: hypothetical protein FJ315_00570 [SAR202 cluster bacterium]|nr:hypothetical protein [SAR202 cluster bacterium]